MAWGGTPLVKMRGRFGFGESSVGFRSPEEFGVGEGEDREEGGERREERGRLGLSEVGLVWWGGVVKRCLEFPGFLLIKLE